MRSIAQYNEINEELIDLKFLMDGKFIPIENIENIIFCKMQNARGCLLNTCPHFEVVSIDSITKENRCTLPNHCNECNKYLLLTTYKIAESERIKEIISDLNRKIPKFVPRWSCRDRCEFKFLEINVVNKEISVVWTVIKRAFGFITMKNDVIEDVFIPRKDLQDKKIGFLASLK